VLQPAQIAAIIPAAGFSSRFAGDLKLLETMGDVSILEQVVRIVRMVGISRILVTTGHGREHIERKMSAAGVRTVFNADFGTGMGTSIATGVKFASHTDGFLIWPGDMPGIAPDTIRALIESSASGKIVVPVHAGRRGHPVLFSEAFRSALSLLGSDEGARSILEAHPASITEVDVNDSGIHMDIDTREDLASFSSLFGRGKRNVIRG